MEVEGTEQNIILQPEGMVVGAVTSVNGQTGDVVLTTSDLENTSDYQTGQDVQDAIAGKQDKLTAGNNIQISEQNVISATNTTYSAGNGINISGENAISVDTTVVATQQNLSDEVTNRENADIYLQGQIDAISASSDVVDIVGTYAELQAYDTQHLKDNDIIKVLQDETQGDATTYYRWSTHTETFTLIGQEGPYYTKAGADTQFVPQTRTVNSKALSANITLTASDVGALGSSDVVQTTGTSTSQVMSQNAVTNELNNKLNVSDYIVDDHLANSTNPVQNQVLNGLLGNMPSDFFSGSATTTPTASTDVQFGNILNLDDVQLLGDTTQETTTGKNLLEGTPWRTVVVSSGYPMYIGTGIAINSSDNNNIDFTSTENYRGVESNYIQIANGTTITVSFTGTLPNRLYVTQYDSNKTRISTLNPSVTTVGTVTVTATQDGYVTVAFANSTSGSFAISNVQMEVGSSATSYEPYTNGPAPNPDYPQAVNVVTGVQSVWAHGKNIIDGSYDGITSFTRCTGEKSGNGFKITSTGQSGAVYATIPVPNYNEFLEKTVTLSYDGIGSNVSVSCYYLASDGKTPSSAYLNNISSGTPFTFPSSIPAGSIGVCLVFYSSVNNNTTYNNIQLELGSTPTSYEPYRSVTYTVDLGAIELCKIGTYQDYIYKSGGDWYVHKETARVDVSSLGGWFASGSYAYKTRNGMSDILPASSDSATAVGLCNAFPASTTNLVYAGSVDYGFALPGAGGVGILIRNKNVASLADFTTYLSNNPVYGYFALATPTDTKITDATLISELEALLNASTYDGETDFVITATGTNLPAPLLLTAVNANAQGIIYKMRG